MAELLVFRSSRLKALGILVGAVAFVCLGVWLAQEKPLVGWLCVGFFSLAIPVSLTMLLKPDVFYLRLDPDGFEMGSPFKRVRTRWIDVDGFEMGSIKGSKLISIRYRPSHTSGALMRRVSEHLSGMQGAIPNNYDRPLTAVLASLQEWHSRFGSGA